MRREKYYVGNQTLGVKPRAVTSMTEITVLVINGTPDYQMSIKNRVAMLFHVQGQNLFRNVAVYSLFSSSCD